jgi:hypothetical protein
LPCRFAIVPQPMIGAMLVAKSKPQTFARLILAPGWAEVIPSNPGVSPRGIDNLLLHPTQVRVSGAASRWSQAEETCLPPRQSVIPTGSLGWRESRREPWHLEPANEKDQRPADRRVRCIALLGSGRPR